MASDMLKNHQNALFSVFAIIMYFKISTCDFTHICTCVSNMCIVYMYIRTYVCMYVCMDGGMGVST